MLEVARAVIREKLKEADEGRSPQWPSVRRAFLRANPTCAGCAPKTGIRKLVHAIVRAVVSLQVHHVKPFHLAPALELDAANLVTTCATHHLYVAHGDDWKAFNPRVREDLAELREHPKRKATVYARAKTARLYAAFGR